jgi:hypothetical protein
MLHEMDEGRISCGLRNQFMESRVLVRAQFAALHLCCLRRQGFMHLCEVVGGRPAGGEAGQPRFQHRPQLEEIDLRGPFAEKRRRKLRLCGGGIALGQKRALSRANFDQAQRLQDADGLPQGGPSHAEELRQFPFRREAVSRFYMSAGDHASDLRDNLAGRVGSPDRVKLVRASFSHGDPFAAY